MMARIPENPRPLGLGPPFSLRAFFLFLSLFVAGANSQQTYIWPDLLALRCPQPFDSQACLFHNSQTIAQEKFLTSDSLIVSRLYGRNWLRQGAYYQYQNAFDLLNKTHAFDAPGEILRHSFPFSFSSAGLEWFPQGTYSRDYLGKTDSSSQNLYANVMAKMRFGPFISLQYQNLPITLGGGPAFNLWQNRMDANTDRDKLDSTRAENGFYVHLNVGDPSLPLIPGIPFYTGGNIQGVYLDSTKITMGNICGLFAAAPKFADSFMVAAIDTLSIGRYANL